MPWNYRVIHSTGVTSYKSVETPWDYFALHEVYYDRAADGSVDESQPRAWSEKPTDIGSEEGVDGIRWLLEKMLAALDKPVLELAEMEAAVKQRALKAISEDTSN